VSLDFVVAVKAISFKCKFFLKRKFHKIVVRKKWLVDRCRRLLRIFRIHSKALVEIFLNIIFMDV
jgi:hypothetical protein